MHMCAVIGSLPVLRMFSSRSLSMRGVFAHVCEFVRAESETKQMVATNEYENFHIDTIASSIVASRWR